MLFFYIYFCPMVVNDSVVTNDFFNADSDSEAYLKHVPISLEDARTLQSVII